MARLVAIAATTILCTLALSVHSRPLQAIGNTATVNATVDLTDRRTISPKLFGIFFEEVISGCCAALAMSNEPSLPCSLSTGKSALCRSTMLETVVYMLR
jgi:hypothetical protein